MSKPKITKLESLQLVLDRHGANPVRWSSEDRDLLAYIEKDAQAKQLFDETKALDQLLELSAVPIGTDIKKHADLQSRILADFGDQFEDKKGIIVEFERTKKAPVSQQLRDFNWLAPAALAASLALGIFLGGFGLGDWTLDPATSIASLSKADNQSADIADIVVSSGFEEDLL